MKLLKCHVENFGTLLKFDYTFQDGLNILLEKNGFGKSTLAVFIKAMFYGLPATTKKDLNENERQKYKPWNGGKFGGSLDFETGSKKYRIERFFGNRASADTFRLWNLSTNQESNDYSMDIGSELFFLDREAYEKSTYFPQLNNSTGMNDCLRAKLSNLVESSNDINNYESAIQLLDDKRKVYRKMGGKGLISEVKDELNKTTRLIEEAQESCQDIDNIRIQMQKDDGDLTKINDQYKKLKEDMALANTQREMVAIKGHYEKLKMDASEARKQLDELDKIFKSGVPSETEINGFLDLSKELSDLESSIKALEPDEAMRKTLEQLNAFFVKAKPSMIEIDEFLGLNGKIERIKASLNELKMDELSGQDYKKLKDTFKNRIPNTKELDEKMDLARQLITVQGELGNFQKQHEDLTRQKTLLGDMRKERISNTAFIVVIILSAILLAGGLGALALFTPLGIGLIVLSFIGALVSAILYLKNYISKKTSLQTSQFAQTDLEIRNLSSKVHNLTQTRDNMISQLEGYIQQFNVLANDFLTALSGLKASLANYERYRSIENSNEAKVASLKEEQSKFIGTMEAFLNHFYEPVPSDYTNALMSLRTNLGDYERLNQTISKNADIRDKKMVRQRELKGLIDNFLLRYFSQIDKNEAELLINLKNKVEDFDKLKDDVKVCEDALHDFMNSKKLDESIETVVLTFNLDELEKEKSNLLKETVHLGEEKFKKQNQINDLLDLANSMTDLEAKKHELEQNQEHYEEQYELIEAAKNYLEAAKSNLAVSYVKTMEEKFGGYLQEFLADEFSKYNISIDLDIQIECEGEKRQLDYFSTGYKDIIDICMRFSLVDALFPEKKPFLILDDPFVNLDNEKLPLAKKILDQISAKYQVLHMICHDVRK